MKDRLIMKKCKDCNDQVGLTFSLLTKTPTSLSWATVKNTEVQGRLVET